MHPEQTNNPLLLVPLTWAMLHIAPLWPILTGYDGTGFILFTVPVVIAGLSVFAAILINRQWARLLVIIGMSIWFLAAFCVLGMEV